ncbi:hypothetical protein [Lysinibacillus sphaericus]|uniref:Uncharacterized protein n=1 Tax=Lysinibacillus sphaericus TaxID=1421 RepID=A0A6H0A0M8_LYSSH|nr:hypothetical protein [Lysinibacillus sphaericus]QIS31113.1 hypothetical protein [Lysinibacillus sphaericus]QPA61330.1 hypothetical protein INQ55_23660 [Lysinibacillus sphaericus]
MNIREYYYLLEKDTGMVFGLYLDLLLIYLYELQQIKDGGDTQSLELGYYLGDKGSWLPAAFGEDYCSAINALESKIKILKGR